MRGGAVTEAEREARLRRKRPPRESKTMRNVKVTEIVFLRDVSESCDVRVAEAKNLIAQMIELSHQRGRPAKSAEEMKDAA